MKKKLGINRPQQLVVVKVQRTQVWHSRKHNWATDLTTLGFSFSLTTGETLLLTLQNHTKCLRAVSEPPRWSAGEAQVIEVFGNGYSKTMLGKDSQNAAKGLPGSQGLVDTSLHRIFVYRAICVSCHWHGKKIEAGGRLERNQICQITYSSIEDFFLCKYEFSMLKNLHLKNSLNTTCAWT